jgi:hypothetical protein
VAIFHPFENPTPYACGFLIFATSDAREMLDQYFIGDLAEEDHETAQEMTRWIKGSGDDVHIFGEFHDQGDNVKKEYY